LTMPLIKDGVKGDVRCIVLCTCVHVAGPSIVVSR